MPLTFRLLTECRPSERRGIGFLEGHGELDAGAEFEEFEGTSDEQTFRSHMDQWLDGANGPSSHFHNFKSDQDHRNCFVFKHDSHRLYGFLCHPKDDDLRFQLCMRFASTTGKLSARPTGLNLIALKRGAGALAAQDVIPREIFA